MQHISKELVETPEHIIKSQIDKLLNNEKIVIYADDLLDLPQEMCIVEEIPDEELVKKINYIISILLLTVNGMLV